MGKNYSFIILSNSGSQLRQIHTPRSLLAVISLVLLMVIGASGYFVFDYFRLKQVVVQNSVQERTISTQSEEIHNQRLQIKKFAQDINQLKESLVRLNGFQKKIRIIANIDKADEQESLFGIGGSIPEDLDPNIELTRKHNALVREMHDQMTQLNQASINQENSFENLLNFLESQRNLLACTPAIRPSDGWTTSRFGYRKSPFTGKREFHKGLDIANRKGSPIIATADGVVVMTGTKGALGRVVVIDHGHGIVTRYAHIDKALKKKGDKVSRGDVIAQVGNTGRSTGPHLHYEVRLNGVPVNPTKYILN